MKYYKVLVGGVAKNGSNYKYPKLGEWTPEIKDTRICESGYHLTTKPEEWYKKGCVVYEAQGKGKRKKDGDKVVFSSVRLVRRVSVNEAFPSWFLPARAFVERIEKEIDSKPSNPLKKWKVFKTREAAREAAGDAAGAAAWGAARGAAGAAAWEAAWEAAWDEAWDAAWDAAWEAARGVAWDAAGDASLMARCLLVKDKIAPHHLAHARERWVANKRGYRVFADVAGVLYVYPAPKKEE